MRNQIENPPSKARVRKHLSADALFSTVYHEFEKVPDPRSGEVEIRLSDALMSGFAMFSLKDPSLLVFEERRKSEAHNLRAIYGIEKGPREKTM